MAAADAIADATAHIADAADANDADVDTDADDTSYYYFSRHYQIAVKIKPLYLTNNTRYLTSNTTRVVQQ
jgi:hypothetical protein